MANSHSLSYMLTAAPPTDRRGRRRQETIAEILGVTVELMERDGVAGVSLSDVARGMGIQPPSLYKYFASRLALYDALFRDAHATHLETVRAAVEAARPGLAALRAGLEASARWCHEHQALAQLLFWRPIPGFEATAEAMVPSNEMVDLFRQVVRDACDHGQLGPGAATDEGVGLLSVLQSGVVTQQLANEPKARFAKGRFVSLLPRAVDMFVAAYPPAPGAARARTRRGGSR